MKKKKSEGVEKKKKRSRDETNLGEQAECCAGHWPQPGEESGHLRRRLNETWFLNVIVSFQFGWFWKKQRKINAKTDGRRHMREPPAQNKLMQMRSAQHPSNLMSSCSSL